MNADAIRVLLVDDDPEIRRLVSDYLQAHGLSVTPAADGRALAAAMSAGSFDIVLLDIMLPGEDGLSLCRKLRAETNLPIILLTALAEESDRVVGLEMGADDYLVKPFSSRELLARIRAVLRRAPGQLPVHRQDKLGAYRFAGWTLDAGARELKSSEGVLITLTAGEFDLLLTLVRHPQRVLNRDQLLELTKGRNAAPFDRSIDVQISRLRRKLDGPALIKTVRGGGYLLACEVERG